jgi:hypothetical protein
MEKRCRIRFTNALDERQVHVVNSIEHWGASITCIEIVKF